MKKLNIKVKYKGNFHSIFGADFDYHRVYFILDNKIVDKYFYNVEVYVTCQDCGKDFIIDDISTLKLMKEGVIDRVCEPCDEKSLELIDYPFVGGM